jgi:hypothetical protein
LDELIPYSVKHIVQLPDVKSDGGGVRKNKSLSFPDCERGKRIPQPHCRMQRSK